MCLFSFKEEEEYNVPARPRRPRSQRYPSPPREVTYVRRVVEERAPISQYAESEKPIALLPPPPPPPPPPLLEAISRKAESSSGRSSRGAPTARSASRAGSIRSKSQYIEVEHGSSSSSSSSSAGSSSHEDDTRSKTTDRTSISRSPTKKSQSIAPSQSPSKAGSVAPSRAASRVSGSHAPSVAPSRSPSKAGSAAPSRALSRVSGSHAPSEVSIYEREQEIRRERRTSRASNPFETYRYVEAPSVR